MCTKHVLFKQQNSTFALFVNSHPAVLFIISIFCQHKYAKPIPFYLAEQNAK